MIHKKTLSYVVLLLALATPGCKQEKMETTKTPQTIEHRLEKITKDYPNFYSDSLESYIYIKGLYTDSNRDIWTLLYRKNNLRVNLYMFDEKKDSDIDQVKYLEQEDKKKINKDVYTMSAAKFTTGDPIFVKNQNGDILFDKAMEYVDLFKELQKAQKDLDNEKLDRQYPNLLEKYFDITTTKQSNNIHKRNLENK